MAKAEKGEEELDLDVSKSSSKKNVILYVIIGVLVLALAGMGAWMFLKGKSGSSGEKEKTAKTEKAIYYEPLKTLVVNFDGNGPAKFLQVDLQVAAHDKEALAQVKENIPAIRNNLLLLLGSQTYQGLSTEAGKEKLRKEIVASINKVLKQQASDGKAKAISSVFFTSFVMQ